MPKNTYVIQDNDGHFYRSFCDSYLTTAHSQVLVMDTTDIERARRFRSLWWATHRAKFLSINASRYYYVYEVTDKETEQKLICRNEQVIERIRKNDSEIMEEIERIIAEWKIR